MADWHKLKTAEVVAIAPLNRDGQPDMYNHLPTRFVTKEEAEARKWLHFYIGDVCSYGHKAPRFVSSPRVCVDCHRVRNGRLTIGGKGEAEYATRKRPYSQRKESVAVSDPTSLEPDPLEKRFLREYADLKDFTEAAYKIGKTAAEFKARMSYSKVFREAVDFLEKQYGLSHTASLTEDFEWTDDKRVVLLRAWVNSGDLKEALTVIGCSNWSYETELRDNPEFAAAVDEVRPWVMEVMDRHAVSTGYKGDNRLFQRVLEANMPDKYGPRMNVNMNLTEKMSAEQINLRFLTLCDELGVRVVQPTVVDGEFSPVEPQRAIEDHRDDGGAGSEALKKQNQDLL